MKFTIKKNTNKKSFDEFVYIAFNTKSVWKNPYKKIKLFTKQFTTYFIIEVLLLVYAIYNVICNPDTLFYIELGVFSMLFIFSIAVFISGKSRINYYYNNSDDSIFEVDDKEIKVESTKMSFKYNWEDIKYIVVNKYSICFLPQKLPGLILSVSIDAKEDIIKMLKKFKKEELFIDNSKLYKKI